MPYTIKGYRIRIERLIDYDWQPGDPRCQPAAKQRLAEEVIHTEDEMHQAVNRFFAGEDTDT